MVGVGVFAIGAILLLMMRGGGSSGDNGMSAFYAAQAASAASGNQLAAVQEQGKAATAIAQIAANRDVDLSQSQIQLAQITGQTSANLAEIGGKYTVQANTIAAQRDVDLANINAAILNQAEITRQQAQKQQFFLGVGQQQLQTAALPFLLQRLQSGNDAVSFWQAQVAGATSYNAAH